MNNNKTGRGIRGLIYHKQGRLYKKIKEARSPSFAWPSQKTSASSFQQQQQEPKNKEEPAVERKCNAADAFVSGSAVTTVLKRNPELPWFYFV